MMSAWIKDEQVALEIFGAELKPRLWLAAKKIDSHIKKLNGIVHGNDLCSDSEITLIRNETVELLDFLVQQCLEA